MYHQKVTHSDGLKYIFYNVFTEENIVSVIELLLLLLLGLGHFKLL